MPRTGSTRYRLRLSSGMGHIADLLGPPELGAVRVGSLPLERRRVSREGLNVGGHRLATDNWRDATLRAEDEGVDRPVVSAPAQSPPRRHSHCMYTQPCLGPGAGNQLHHDRRWAISLSASPGARVVAGNRAGNWRSIEMNGVPSSPDPCMSDHVMKCSTTRLWQHRFHNDGPFRHHRARGAASLDSRRGDPRQCRRARLAASSLATPSSIPAASASTSGAVS
jgi:hypothetical protein